MEKKIRTISLFSGGGGLDIGFEKAGFDILFATDVNNSCCETLKLNRGNTLNKNLTVLEADIRTMDLDLLPSDIDMVIGGPPCQSYSASGRRAGGAAGTLDARGTLFEGYCEVLKRVKPKAFLFENVRGILATNKGEDFRNIVKSFAELGYKIEYRILDAEDYGVPQQRERMFIVGHKLKGHFLYPRPLYGSDSINKTPYISVGEAIKDIKLTPDEEKETRFEGGKYCSLLPLVPPGENYLHFTAKRGYENPIFAYRSRFSDFLYKANPATPVKTLIASPGKYTGPLHWENRYLTVNEYKRIQGFPDEHIFFGKRSDQIRQIGNSVVPKIAYYLALAIKEEIFGIPTNLEYLPYDEKLSFDKRKHQKAKKTRALHDKVAKENISNPSYMFTLSNYESYTTPSSSNAKTNTKVTYSDNYVFINVHCGGSRKIQAKLNLLVYDGINKDRTINVLIKVTGDKEYGVQTMWNAFDGWVKRSSNLHSLVDMYGHFTEPHPIFKIVSFENKTNLPVFKFAEYYMNFDRCATYFPKNELLKLWGNEFNEESFTSLERTLRSYRFDIRSNETNIAIPNNVYMVAYPFCLPYDKQMNFTVKG